MKHKHHEKHAMHEKHHHHHKMSEPSHGTSEHPGRPMGHGEFANMPQHPIMKAYPVLKSGDKHLDDTIVRLDGDSVDAEKKVRKNMSKGMY